MSSTALPILRPLFPVAFAGVVGMNSTASPILGWRTERNGMVLPAWIQRTCPSRCLSFSFSKSNIHLLQFTHCIFFLAPYCRLLMSIRHQCALFSCLMLCYRSFLAWSGNLWLQANDKWINKKMRKILHVFCKITIFAKSKPTCHVS